MENMELYEALRKPPDEALKRINGGRMSGKTDINPMWRIKALTEKLGPCGIGWKYEVVRFWLENGAKGEIAAFAQINLYVKLDEKWSEPIPGIGGNAFVSNEKNGLYTNDECYKMALTDAISVSCKAIGVGGDIYWETDPTKYRNKQEPHSLACDECGGEIKGIKYRGRQFSPEEQAERWGICTACLKKKAAENG